MKAVIKGTGYVLVHTPDMVLHNGTTQRTEKIVNPDSDFLKELPKHLRSYEDCVAYYPNQAYIGGFRPDQLKTVEAPLYDKKMEGAQRYAKFGEIMPQDEFYLLMQISDEFDLVKLEKGFVAATKEKLAKDPIITEHMMSRVKEGVDLANIEQHVKEEDAEGLYMDGKLVGCVNRAHDIDTNLSSHVMHENIASKASSVLALAYGVKNSGLPIEEIAYVIDCAEEACGDMNQRGGGNFAKAAAEIVGLTAASGCDIRGFCAAPAHSLLSAASLVKAGVFKAVAVTAGGCTAKLGMNSKDHIKKDVPVLEDCLAGVSIIIGQDDGVSPYIDLEHTGRHTVGTGSAPQAVISALVTDPLDAAGLKVTDVDKFSPEMQNPDITKPAGAGDVPLANMKMIAALAVKKGHLEKKDFNDFIPNHGLTGFAPTQGHIPSGVPILGFAREELMAGNYKRVMVIGKGSLFLGRLTNLFDGVSFLVERNEGLEEEAGTGADTKAEIQKQLASALKGLAQSLLAAEEA